jgi:undecaprenyl-diphosphatase
VHTLIRFIADYFILIPLLTVVYMLLKLKGRRREFIAVLVLGGIISLLLAKLGSHLYHDPRPFVQGHFTPLIGHSTDNGFPSDHTLLASFIGWLVLAYDRKWGIALLLVAALIGGARMAAGVHHLSDIAGSFVFAGVGCWAAYMAIRTLGRRHAPDHEA